MDSDYGNAGSALRPGLLSREGGRAAIPNASNIDPAGQARIELYAQRADAGLDIFTGQRRGYEAQQYIDDDK